MRTNFVVSVCVMQTSKPINSSPADPWEARRSGGELWQRTWGKPRSTTPEGRGKGGVSGIKQVFRHRPTCASGRLYTFRASEEHRLPTADR